MSKVSIYNTYTKKKEPLALEIIEAQKKFSFYVCGVTTYDEMHLGHARVFLVFDAFQRFLKSQGINVFYVRNFTDIDDKIIQKAQKEHKSPKEISEKYIQSALEDEKALNIESPNQRPKATDYIQEMIQFIEKLMVDGYAYRTNSGDVYFKVNAFKSYGTLSNKDLKALKENVRIENNEEKESPVDFTLWKHQKSEHEISYEAPFGKGRPGWHIECSAMCLSVLGQSFSLHGGGPDLLFPHHENERAQSMSLGFEFSKQWMHVGALLMGQEKMSKSLGNTISLKETLSQYGGEVIRFLMLKTHYRKPLYFDRSLLEDAKSELTSLYEALLNFKESLPPKKEDSQESLEFFEALGDDFNTPKALKSLTSIARRSQKTKDETEAHYMAFSLWSLGSALGLFLFKKEEFPKALFEVLGFCAKAYFDKEDSWMFQETNKVLEDSAKLLIKKRALAKKNQDFQTADAIRDELLTRNIFIRDLKEHAVFIFQKNS